ncbi:glycosyltransferase family 20-domain-containing protein [Protomyces lactucae-debilis]|uniref:Glycosyltransferase family 20-domain-containing protein n=1 Tax=Protomyces lactucae-debilis TaxID=2754530 RepID=A0A1Y2FW98_PROLT|nr:glycosyltransferase family 20-domain-containing protein [Protomyces lactucae-debilis]ORY87574.1 glycosyltransferase family 20-domain-containing protein [Protomyces lactucae-debilis]
MTTFVCALFLPKTLKFVVEETDSNAASPKIGHPSGDDSAQRQQNTGRPSAATGKKDAQAPTASLAPVPNLMQSFASSLPNSTLNTPSQLPTSPTTPPKSNGGTPVFMVDAPSEDMSSSQHQSGMSSLHARLQIAQREGQSPGMATTSIPGNVRKRVLQVPKSRASSPPPAAIVPTRPAFPRQASKTRPAEVCVMEDQPAPKQGSPNLLRMADRRRSLTTDPRYANAHYEIFDQLKGNGGLRHAIAAASQTGSIGKVKWVGSCGFATDAIDKSTMSRIKNDFEVNLDSLIVTVSDGEFSACYSHYCKRILWPLFHYQIPDQPRAKVYEEKSWKEYVAVNQAFADLVCSKYKRGDVVMVNDYHLLLVPGMIRKRHPQAMIGLFLHITFPSSEIFRCLAMRMEILEGMLGANLIGFQTESHCDHFKQTCSRLLYIEALEQGIQLEHSFVSIVAMPIGVDPAQLERCMKAPEVSLYGRTVRERQGGKKIIFGRDKLDSVKGVKQKLLAYERFLSNNPSWRDRVIMLQYGQDSKTEPELKQQITDIVNRINGRFTDIISGHIPVHLVEHDIDYNEFLGILSICDCFMVTSLREGMNLTCHEYIYSQRKLKNPLILSEFVGSATVLDKDSLMINPFDYKQTANAILQALTMSQEEKNQRWEKLNKIILEDDASLWATTFISRIQSDFVLQQRRRTVDLPKFNPDAFLDQFDQAASRLFFIDYEGTLLPWGSHKQIMASTNKIVEVLSKLCADERNLVYVTSERTPSELERTFRRVHRLGLIAENGGYLRTHEEGNWENLTSSSDLSWKPNVREILTYYRERTPGSVIEEQNSRMVFHYAQAEDPVSAQRQAAECCNHISDICAPQGAHAIPMEGALVVEPVAITKASAAQRVLASVDGRAVGFLIVFGNDRADEEIFAWANGLALDKEQDRAQLSSSAATQSQLTALTVTVGSRNTDAKTYVQSTFGVLSALAALSGDKQATSAFASTKPSTGHAMTRENSMQSRSEKDDK